MASDDPDAVPVTGEALEASEALPADHRHDRVSADDGTLDAHLRSAHHLDLETSVSASTLNGLHDRVHEESHAVDE